MTQTSLRRESWRKSTSTEWIAVIFVWQIEETILAEFGHRQIHQNPPSGGVSACCATFRNERMFEHGRNLVRNERYSGPWMIEFKHDKNKDRFVLIEVNPKFWGSSLLSIMSGINFPLIYVRYLQGEVWAHRRSRTRPSSSSFRISLERCEILVVCHSS